MWFPLFVFSGLGLDLEVLLNRTVNISLLLPSPNSMEVITSFLVGDKGVRLGVGMSEGGGGGGDVLEHRNDKLLTVDIGRWDRPRSSK